MLMFGKFHDKGIAMNIIHASDKSLSFEGNTQTALYLVETLHDGFKYTEMPNMLSDFVFSIQMALQNAGVLDENFNEIDSVTWDFDNGQLIKRNNGEIETMYDICDCPTSVLLDALKWGDSNGDYDHLDRLGLIVTLFPVFDLKRG